MATPAVAGREPGERAPLVWRTPPNLLFDGVEMADSFDSFGGDRGVVGLHQVEELAPDMRHTGRFLDRAIFIELIESGIRVGLKDAAEACQMSPWVLSLAVRRVGEPDCRRIVRTGRTVIADIGPEPSGLGLARARSKHRNRRVVPMQLVRRENVAAQHLDQRNEQAARCADPLSQSRAVQLDALRA